MKKLLIASMLAAQLAGGGAPVMAHAGSAARGMEAGAFAGVRLRAPFGGARREPVRAGLAFAPTLRSEHGDGRASTRIGEGLEFGYRSGRPLSFSIAGRDLQPPRLAAAQASDDGRRGRSTRNILLIAGGVVLVVAVVAATAYVYAGTRSTD